MFKPTRSRMNVASGAAVPGAMPGGTPASASATRIADTARLQEVRWEHLKNTLPRAEVKRARREAQWAAGRRPAKGCPAREIQNAYTASATT